MYVSDDMATYMRERRRRRRLLIIELLGNKCSQCGINVNLETDHIDRSTKEFTLSGCDLDRSWSKILEEVKKCQLLCEDHHLAKSRENGDISAGGGHNKILDPQHGTAVKYKSCKCPECRKWKSLYRRKLVDAQGNPR